MCVGGEKRRHVHTHARITLSPTYCTEYSTHLRTHAHTNKHTRTQIHACSRARTLIPAVNPRKTVISTAFRHAELHPLPSSLEGFLSLSGDRGETRRGESDVGAGVVVERSALIWSMLKPIWTDCSEIGEEESVCCNSDK